MNELSHTDSKGKARMVDIGNKPVMVRIARAGGHITLAAGTLSMIRENQLKKGDVLSVARIAAISASKQTSSLIPLCHNIVLDDSRVELKLDETGVYAECEVRCEGKTGAEMEALVSVTVALLTVYDMCKAVDKTMKIDNVELIEKSKNAIT